MIYADDMGNKNQEDYRGMREIICGAGGFLGSNLRRHFEDKDKEVIILPTEMLLDVPTMHKFFEEHEPYHLYYLAAYGNLHGQSDIQEMFQASVTKFINVLKATEGTECKAIVTAGSTSEYGNKLEPMVEDQIVCPKTFYGAAKAAATHIAQAWATSKDSPVVVFRPASITGLGEQSIHLIPILINSCLFGSPMPFNPEGVHDYIDVKDVCSAVEILADNAVDRKGEIFNVGNGRQYTNLEVKQLVEEITHKKANVNKAITHTSQNTSDVWIADSSKMQALGWKPKKTLRDSIKEMVWAI